MEYFAERHHSGYISYGVSIKIEFLKENIRSLQFSPKHEKKKRHEREQLNALSVYIQIFREADSKKEKKQ